jgi:hypothetical protein
MTIVFKSLNGSAEVDETTEHRGGFIQIQASGSFDGATLSLLVTHNAEQPFLALNDYEKTDQNVVRFDLKSGAIFKFEINGSGGSEDITVSILQ